MILTDFLAELTKESKNFSTFEYNTLLMIIKYCDTDTRNTFFPNAVAIDGYDDGYPEVTKRLVAYAIHTITDYSFHKTITNMVYSQDVAPKLRENAKLRWQFILKLFVQSLDSENKTDIFWTEFTQLISTPQFVIGTLFREVVESYQYSKILLEMVQIYQPASYEQVYQSWLQIAGDKNMDAITQEDYFGQYITDTRLAEGITNEVKSAIMKQTEVSDSRETGRTIWSGTGVYGSYEIINHHRYKVGQDVVKWINTTLPDSYGLKTNYSITTSFDEKTSEWHNTAQEMGCVLGTTLITMSDGTTKPILELRENDSLLSEGQSVSKLSDEIIVNQQIHVLYGINDIEPFMSLDHAVMTEEGWKSLNPVKSNECNPFYQVTMLKKGDVVITRNGNVRVDQIKVEYAKEGEQFTGYDLHFREGRHSYYANGILVLQNYPEITGARIRTRLMGLNMKEQQQFFQLMEHNTDLLEKLLGMDAIHYIKEEIYAEFKNHFNSIT